jgi:Fe2+ or Zn2+ uptake regulation protein
MGFNYETSMNTNSWLNQLQSTGCRLTGARRIVVHVMESSQRALTPVEVYDAARNQDSHIGLVTVYRTLEKLEDLGLIQRVHQTKDCQAFIRAGDGHQHLIVCTHCGKAVLFEGDQLDPLFNSVAKTTGFQIKSHWLQVFGLCKTCRSDS